MFHLRCSTGSEYISASFFPGIFYILLGKKVLQGKMGELRNEFFQMFGETSSNKLLFSPKKAI